MTRQLSTLAILFLGFLTVYGQGEKDNQGLKSNFIKLKYLTVFQFIELLKIDKNNSELPKVLTIVGMQIPQNWVTETDIDSLVTLLNSTEPSKCVMQAISSSAPLSDGSTIGGQVMSIIEAYKDNRQYPTFLTSCARADEKRIEKIKQWWDGKKK